MPTIERERARLWRKKERGPGSGNNKERATLWEQKREGHVVKQLKGQVVGTIKRGPGCGNKRCCSPVMGQ